jgi:hypothetical protein
VEKIIAKDALLSYLDFTLPFDIHTDASHTQIGSVISHRGKPIGSVLNQLLKKTRVYGFQRVLPFLRKSLRKYSLPPHTHLIIKQSVLLNSRMMILKKRHLEMKNTL